MPVNRYLTRKVIYSATLFITLIPLIYLTAIKAVNLDTYKEQITTELQKSLKRPASYSSAELTFGVGPAVTLHGILIKEPDNSADFLSIDSLTIHFELLPLIKKEFIAHSVVAKKAIIRLERYADATFNFSDLLKADDSSAAVRLRDIKIKDSDITFYDNLIKQKIRFTEANIQLGNLIKGGRGLIKASSKIGDGTFACNAKIRIPSSGDFLKDSYVDAKLNLKNFDTTIIWPYVKSHMPFVSASAFINTDTEFHGKLAAFSSSGQISLAKMQMDYRPVFRKPLESNLIKLKYFIEVDSSNIRIKGIEANVDGGDVKGSFALLDYRGKDPIINAHAVTSRLDFEKYRQYIPYGIIVKGPGDWIEEHLTGGQYQLEEGRLEGKISQILHMELGENYNVLYIKAKAEKGVVSHGATVPTFNNIKGTLVLKGKDFSLHGMSGFFGTSPMTLDGRITDYPLDKPSGYPFKMTISPSREEAGWLVGKEISTRLGYNGNSSLTLTGDGYTSSYTLSGDWNLSPATYSYGEYISKPAGTVSNAKFRALLTPKQAVLSPVQLTLGPLALNISAQYPFENGLPTNLLISSNSFQAEAVAPMSKILSRYQPAGNYQVFLKGERPYRAKDFNWNGSTTMNNASLKYSPTEKPVSNINGTISTDGSGYISNQLTARIGNSTFSGKGVIKNIDPLTLNATFYSPRIDLADFGIKPPSPLISNVNGDVSYINNELSIRGLSGQLNNSQLRISGIISDIEKMKCDLTVNSSYLDISDLIPLGYLEVQNSKKSAQITPSLKIHLKADKLQYETIKFERTLAEVDITDNVIRVNSLNGKMFAGELSATGSIDLSKSQPSFQSDFKLTNASADSVTEYFSGASREISGTMSVQGEIKATGIDKPSLLRSAVSQITIHSTNGALRRFSGLSKVFSILNVSQLLKLKLPDVMTEGMPYTDLKGTITIKGGILETKDSYLASNSLNMSMVGKHDFIKDNMDFILGVQPLQTVDKIVSKIPIIGWVLTGKNKAMITTYFEIKGPSNAPQVTAVPMSSLGKGVAGIFTRLFQLPAKIFSNTGEVLLGQ